MAVFRYVSLGGAMEGSVRCFCCATEMQAGVGSMAVTEEVDGWRAHAEAKMPPPHPMSR